MEIYDEKEFKKKGLVCVQELQSVKQFNEMKDSEDVIFVFSADWCPDCRFIEPVLPEIEEQYPGYSFVEVNRDEFMEVAEEHDIFGIPSFLAFQDGKEAGRFVSKDRKTKDEIISFIDGLAK
jgi:thiol-disulfide isomerase/thioredoxin